MIEEINNKIKLLEEKNEKINKLKEELNKLKEQRKAFWTKKAQQREEYLNEESIKKFKRPYRGSGFASTSDILSYQIINATNFEELQNAFSYDLNKLEEEIKDWWDNQKKEYYELAKKDFPEYITKLNEINDELQITEAERKLILIELNEIKELITDLFNNDSLNNGFKDISNINKKDLINFISEKRREIELKNTEEDIRRALKM